MKKLVNVVETVGGFETFMGQVITVYCANFIYTGTLTGVNDRYILLSDASIVYETGAHQDKNWKTAEKLPNGEWYCMISAIESFGIFKGNQ